MNDEIEHYAGSLTTSMDFSKTRAYNAPHGKL